jgi:hypothetical protein
MEKLLMNNLSYGISDIVIEAAYSVFRSNKLEMFAVEDIDNVRGITDTIGAVLKSVTENSTIWLVLIVPKSICDTIPECTGKSKLATIVCELLNQIAGRVAGLFSCHGISLESGCPVIYQTEKGNKPAELNNVEQDIIFFSDLNSENWCIIFAGIEGSSDLPQFDLEKVKALMNPGEVHFF